MVQAIIMLSACVMILVMLSVFYSLWDILSGRWSDKKRMQNQIDDQDEFDSN